MWNTTLSILKKQQKHILRRYFKKLIITLNLYLKVELIFHTLCEIFKYFIENSYKVIKHTILNLMKLYLGCL